MLRPFVASVECGSGSLDHDEGMELNYYSTFHMTSLCSVGNINTGNLFICIPRGKIFL